MLEKTPEEKIELLEVQVEHYKEMYENQKEYNNKILTTIFWSLGTVAAFLVLFVGASFFYNSTVNKKEIESEIATLKEDISMEINSSIPSSIESSIDRYTQETNNKISDMNREIYSSKREIAIAEARYWNQEGVDANEARVLIEAINYGLETGYTDGFVLRDLINILKQMDDFSSLTGDLAEMLPKLDDEYRFEREEIENILK